MVAAGQLKLGQEILLPMKLIHLFLLLLLILLLGVYNLCVRTVVPNDAYLANNILCNLISIDAINDVNTVVFEVSQNEPNPASGNTRIDYTVPNNENINFELRNTIGQLIYTANQAIYAGNNIIEIDANKLANGIYYYYIIFDEQRMDQRKN